MARSSEIIAGPDAGKVGINYEYGEESDFTPAELAAMRHHLGVAKQAFAEYREPLQELQAQVIDRIDQKDGPEVAGLELLSETVAGLSESLSTAYGRAEEAAASKGTGRD